MIGRLSDLFGRALSALATLGCLLMLAMMLIIVADVTLRNLTLPGLPKGLAWSNEVSEAMLYLITMCVAPWLLRQGQHIRVDILLQAIPRRLAWTLEWVGDLIGLGCCVVLAYYGWKATASSFIAGSVNIKTLVTPEWWWLVALPVTFTLLTFEMLFRMHRLAQSERGPRHDAVSAA